MANSKKSVGAANGAASKKTDKPVIVKKSEKTVSATATRTPQKKKTVSPEPVVPLAEHDKVKADLVSAKIQTTKEKEKAQDAEKKADHFQRLAGQWEAKYNSVKDKVDNTVSDTRGWINRGNKWVFAIPGVLLAIIVYIVLSIQNKDLKKERDKYKAASEQVQTSKREQESKENLEDVRNETLPAKQEAKKKSEVTDFIKQVTTKPHEIKTTYPGARDTVEQHRIIDSLFPKHQPSKLAGG